VKADTLSRVLAWLALLAAVVLTAAGEYALFVGCGFGRWVSAAGPACLDAYALAAIRARREVLPAVLVMIAANATAHLLPADGAPVGVVVAAAAVAPLVLWRTHVLLDDQSPAPAIDPVQPLTVPAPPEVPAVFERPSTTAEGDQAHDHPGDQSGDHVTAVPLVLSVVPELVESEAAPVDQDDHPDDQEPPSDADLRRAARALHRRALKDGRPVTVDALRTGLGVSRRRAVSLRREVVGAAR
jgi:hypothetical protein